MNRPSDALATEEGWFEVDLPSAGLHMTDDSYIGYAQTNAENHPWLGVDNGTANAHRCSVPHWNLLLPSEANAMIRVRFAGE